MKQLVQLQERYGQFEALDAEIVAVQREEKIGFEGLQKIRQEQGVTFVILNDYQSEQTPSYSQGGFFTYIIDKQGEIRAILPGTKFDRPSGQVILETLQQALRPE